MPQKIYLKDQSFDPIYKSMNLGFYFKSKILSGTLMALGFMILSTQVAIPLVFFKTQNEVAEPMRQSVLGYATGFDDFSFNELGQVSSGSTEKTNTSKNFYLSIPKLGIKNALVETNSKDLNPQTSLGHYNGSALPGERGNTFIYGHSVLPWFFNPKNYLTIFSTLDKLNVGDEFSINMNNKLLSYRVESKEILPPDKVNPLFEFKPKYLNESTVTLMTCYPAGTRAKRLLLNAVLIT